MKKYWILGIAIGILLGACQKNTANEKRVEEINPGNEVADIIRNPASAAGLIDTNRLAKMTFSETQFNFGEIEEGEVVEHVFQFTNTGKVPLIISDARSTCGCTVPEWSKEPIEPGANSEIKVRFDSTGKKGEQLKPITITANTYPSETVLYLGGFVREKHS